MKKLMLVLAMLVASPVFAATTIHVEAENCGITGNYYSWNPGWTSGPILLFGADNSGNFQNAEGTLQLTIPVAIPNGTYEVSVKWKTGNPGGTYAYLLNTTAGTLVENDTFIQGGWHTFYPTASDLYTTDFLAGHGTDLAVGPIWTGSPKGSSITVNGVGANNFNLYLWDMTAGNYQYMGIDYIEFTAIPEPATMSMLALGVLALIRRK